MVLTVYYDQNSNNCDHGNSAVRGRKPLARQIWLIMKLTTLLLTVALLQAGATGFTQTVTYEARNAPLKKVFSEIRRQTGLAFFYNNNDFSDTKNVTVRLNNVPILTALDQILKDQPLTYFITRNTIFIRRKEAVAEPQIADLLDIRGKVVNDKGEPLAGATISVKGKQIMTVTSEAGEFVLTGVDRFDVLVITSVGYKDREVAINGRSTLTVTLEQNVTGIDQVVVVGYGTQRKVNLTGAVSTVDVSKTLDSRPLNDATKALQGAVPGLTITYGNGGLNTAPSINVRGVGSVNGTGSPLILVDNVETSDLSIINPNEIESISVLKDAASTSIYGARAAFGVILIKTKSGKRNLKPSVTYNNYFSWSKPTVLPQFTDPVVELQALYDANVRSGVTSPELFGMQLLTLKTGIENWQKNYAHNRKSKEMVEGEDYKVEADGRTYFYRVWDQYDEMLEDYSQHQMHNIQVQGGSENIGYYVSSGFSRDAGILKMNPDRMTKYNITASLNATVNKWVDLDVRMLYRNQEFKTPYKYQDYWYYLLRWGSYFPYGTKDGYYFRHVPAFMYGANSNTNRENYQRVDVGATFKLHKNLNLRADYTIGRNNLLRHEVGGPILAWDFWSSGPLKLTNIATAAQDRVTYGQGRYLVNTLNLYATYQKSFGAHNIKLMAGANAEDNEDINFTAEKLSLLDPSKGELALASGDQFASGGHLKNAYAGYFGRVNYNYRGKYLLELNGRYDGSSAFSPTDRWAFFSSASLGYRISQESFMDFIKPFVTDLKLRASLGSVGNQNVGGNWYLASMSGLASNWIDGTSRMQTISAPVSVAKSLTWETVKTLDIGLDLRILQNKIGLSFDWYERNTNGMLAPTSVPGTFGNTGPRVNSGTLRNRGWEIAIDANHQFNNGLDVYAILTLADNKAVITKWDNPSMLIMQNYVGKTYGEIWGFLTDRYFTSVEDVQNSPSQVSLQNGNFVYGPGDIKYKDLNGDNVINGGSMSVGNTGDLVVIGNSEPRYQYGARLGAKYKGFDIDIFLQGVGKRDFWGLGNIFLPLYQGGSMMHQHQMDFWTPENPNAYYPRPYVNNNATKLAGMPTTGNNFYPQDKYLLNLAYCRLKNLTIGYTLPSNLLDKFNVKSFRVFLSGQNLAEIANVGVPLDPEITMGELNFLGRTFPFLRTYAIGCQLNF